MGVLKGVLKEGVSGGLERVSIRCASAFFRVSIGSASGWVCQRVC